MLKLSYAQRQMLAAKLRVNFDTLTQFAHEYEFSTDTISKMLGGIAVRQSSVDRVLEALVIEREDFYAPDLMTV